MTQSTDNLSIKGGANPLAAVVASDETDLPVVRIVPTSGWASLKLRELIEYRELLFFLIWRDIKVRYKQTVLGASWAIIQPFMTMVVFSLFFGNLAQVPSDGVPYPIFSYVALVPWTFFATSLANSSNSLVSSANMIKKIYFPRLIIPIASSVSGIVDFLLAFVVLLALLLFYQIPLTVNVLFLPLFLLLALIVSLGAGMWLSAMNVQFRDIKYIVPFLTQLWMFVTPVAYPASLIKNDTLRTLYGLNPMTGVIEGFRWALLNTGKPPDGMFVVSWIIALLLFVSGLFYFRRLERTFADVA